LPVAALPTLLPLRAALGILAAPTYPACGRAIAVTVPTHLQGGSKGYVGYVFVFWFYLYLVQVRHFNLLRAAWMTSLPWILSLVVIPLGGFVSDWAVKRCGATWGRRSVPMPALILAAGLLAWGAHTESPAFAVGSLTLSTALVLSSEGPFWATMTQLSGPHSGTGGGVMNFGSNLGGLLSPLATPWLAS
jgi:MFS transporter, ACS family, glucarate transporter